MSDRIWEGAAILHPTKKGSEDGELSAIIVQPHYFLAKTENAATMLVARQIKDGVDLDRVEIAVRPF